MTNDIPRQNGAAEALPRGITYWNDEKRKLRWCWERRIEGKRVRTFFSSLEAAKRGKALAEAAMLSGADGRKVFDGASQREYEAAKRIVGDEVSLIDVAIFYRAHENLRVKKTEKLSKIADISLEELERRRVPAEACLISLTPILTKKKKCSDKHFLVLFFCAAAARAFPFSVRDFLRRVLGVEKNRGNAYLCPQIFF